MSEYQYYEFLAVDRPLTEAQRAQLRALSTRAEITATRFTNEYQWGDFKGDPQKMMERYFDAHLYFANWGTRRLMLRVPRTALDTGIAQRTGDLQPGYHAGNAVETSTCRHRIAVRADRDHAEFGLAAFDPADQIAGGIDPRRQSGLGEAPREPGPAFEKQLSKRASRIGPCRIGDLAQRHDIRP